VQLQPVAKGCETPSASAPGGQIQTLPGLPTLFQNQNPLSEPEPPFYMVSKLPDFSPLPRVAKLLQLQFQVATV